MNATRTFDAFAGEKYLSLETFRRNGVGVPTAVWFAADADEQTLYVYATADSGKAKRLRRSAVVRIAPCDGRGKVTGDWMDAEARIVGAHAFDHGMRLLNKKYRPWKQMLDFSVLLFARHQRIVIAIQPAMGANQA